MKRERCSINWGKRAAIMAIVGLVLLALAAFGAAQMSAANKVAVDWGSFTQPCRPTDPKCQAPVAVDWGSLVAPCLPTNPKCGPVAVDWGNSFSPMSRPKEPVQVAVDWGSSYSPTSRPKDPVLGAVS